MGMHRKLSEARLLAAKKLPYLTHSVMALIPVEKPGLGTMAVDDYGRLYFDPGFLEDRDLKHLAFVVLHESIHVFGRHPKRCQRLLGEKPANDRLGVWRQAVDASVNDVLEQSRLECPEEGITPAKLGLPRNKTPEEYFNMLLERAEQQKKQEPQEDTQGSDKGDAEPSNGQDDDSGQDQGDQEGENPNGESEEGQAQADGEGEAGENQPGAQAGMGEAEGDGQGEPDASEVGGSSMDGQPRPWEDGQPSAEQPGMSEHEQNLIEAATAKAIENYQEQRGQGSVAGGLARQASDLLHPKVDPARELLAKVKYAVGCTSGFGDFTYRRPSRRQPAGGAILPAHVKPIPRVTVIIDTSGSMDDSDLKLALGVLGNALRSLPDPRGLRVLAGDTAVACAKNVFIERCIDRGTDGGSCVE